MKSSAPDLEVLKKKASKIRKQILEVTNRAKCGHPGGSLSAVEIFISLYEKMNHKPDNPTWEGRDRLIVSKGHASPVTYVALCNYGYFPEKELETYRMFNSRLQGHVHVKTPGVEFNTGSLGHGLSVANGIAMAAKMQKKDFNVFCLLGDGEIQEGSVWEAAMSAAQFKLGHVCAIVDYNKIQENGPTQEIMALEPLANKWKDFGWNVIEADGHDIEQMMEAIDGFDKVKDGEVPTVIIAHTVKGKGISFMENTYKWHGKAPNDEQLGEALAELKE